MFFQASAGNPRTGSSSKTTSQEQGCPAFQGQVPKGTEVMSLARVELQHAPDARGTRSPSQNTEVLRWDPAVTTQARRGGRGGGGGGSSAKLQSAGAPSRVKPQSRVGGGAKKVATSVSARSEETPTPPSRSSSSPLLLRLVEFPRAWTTPAPPILYKCGLQSATGISDS